jgi:hypothetical protein
MMAPVVFYSRCKPGDADAIDLALENKRIFIGWAMPRMGAAYDPRNLKSCIVDLTCPDDEWTQAKKESDGSRQYQQNRNLVEKVTMGSLALIPRPSRGVIYCGKVTSPFRLENSPPWYDRYVKIREAQGLAADSDEHAADVAQCWEVDRFRPVPVPLIPAWIRRSLFGRSTYGIIRRNDYIGENPHEVLSRTMDRTGFEVHPWTLDRSLVERRLLQHMTPDAFEHLVVSLLQLEHPEEVWSQVGGSGDGGIDGIGAAADGRVAALLQCKWQYEGGDPFPPDHVWGQGREPFRKYLAALLCPADIAPPVEIKFLDRMAIAELVLKHHERLPQAVAMRVGAGH